MISTSAYVGGCCDRSLEVLCVAFGAVVDADKLQAAIPLGPWRAARWTASQAALHMHCCSCRNRQSTCVGRSCTGGKTEDFQAAARLLHRAGGRVVVPTFLVPATQKVWADVYGQPLPDCGGLTAAQVIRPQYVCLYLSGKACNTHQGAQERALHELCLNDTVRAFGFCSYLGNIPRRLF